MQAARSMMLRTPMVLCVAFCGVFASQAASSIEITNTPVFASSDDLEGQALEADPATHRVAVFIFIPGAGWWSKPFCDPDLTIIQPGGDWTADITTGGVDEFATEITALLVSSNYNEPCVMGLPTLPTNVLAQAIDSDTVVRVDPSVRWIRFSGYDWWVKSSLGPVGPGPNIFSDSTNNVWLDTEGRLHLRITNVSNQWQCAEVVTDRTFGYGSYRFELESVVDDLDPNVVLGLFTWSDDPAYTHREIDVECGRWGNSNDVNNAQFVVQPWNLPGHLVRYAVPAGSSNSTHLFTWATNQILFESQIGGYTPEPGPTNVLGTYAFTNAAAVPQSGDENVRMNLWLMNGNPPTDSNEVEVVVRSFQFVPPGPPQPAQLTDPAASASSQMTFNIQGQMDRRYEIERTTNGISWDVLATVLATNAVTPFTDTNGTNASSSQFYRAQTLP